MNPATQLRRQALIKKIADALVTATRDGIDPHQLATDALAAAVADPRWVDKATRDTNGDAGLPGALR